MKIVPKTIAMVAFKDVPQGECFYFDGIDVPYMKGAGKNSFYVVNLAIGLVEECTLSDTVVRLVDSKLEIEEG